MAGPCSLPNGGRREYDEQWILVCDIHRECYPDHCQEFDRHGNEIKHDFISQRLWLLKRNRLKTGKTR